LDHTLQIQYSCFVVVGRHLVILSSSSAGDYHPVKAGPSFHGDHHSRTDIHFHPTRIIVAFSVRTDRELRHGCAKLAASNRCREILLPIAKK
jgi:hypothetical protein